MAEKSNRRYSGNHEEKGLQGRKSNSGHSEFRGRRDKERGRFRHQNDNGDQRHSSSNDGRGGYRSARKEERPFRRGQDNERRSFRRDDDRGGFRGDDRRQSRFSGENRDHRGQKRDSARSSFRREGSSYRDRGSHFSDDRGDFQTRGDRGHRSRPDNDRGASMRRGDHGGFRGRRNDDRKPYRRVRDDSAASRPGQTQRDLRPRDPEVPEFISGRELESTVVDELRTLSKESAERVGKHMVAAGYFLNEDIERACEHARAAARKGGRVGAVRELAGIVLYQGEQYKEAVRELRAAYRINATKYLLPLIADCERGLGRPEKALEIFENEKEDLTGNDALEMILVVSGALQDQGQLEQAQAVLEIPELKQKVAGKWPVRLWVAYADILAANGKAEESEKWLKLAADADHERLTDAADRLGMPAPVVVDGPWEDNERVEIMDVFDPEAEKEENAEADADIDKNPVHQDLAAADDSFEDAVEDATPAEEEQVEAIPDAANEAPDSSDDTTENFEA